MCSGAVVWANMKGVVFGANVKDLGHFQKPQTYYKKAKRNFMFVPCSKILTKTKLKIFIIPNFMRKECLELFNLYKTSVKR
jgi:tRNA(Arg) A34 adenosine deaminase TadA